MRAIVLLIGLAFVSGCGGSKSDAPVDLSIDNPKKAEKEAAASSTDIETPENARKLLINAARLAKQGLVGKAAEQLSHAISMNPEDPELYIARAEVYGIMREDASALADYSTAVRVRPSDSSIHNRRGFFLLSRNEYTRAVKDFSEAIRLKPDSPQAYNNRGLVYLSINDPKKAIADFSKAVKLDPKYADAWNNRGFAQYKQKQYKAALGDLSKALAVKPNYVNALNNRGLTYLAMKNYDAVVTDMTSAIAVAPYELKLFQARRTAHIGLQDFASARQDASRIEWLVQLAALTKEIDRAPTSYDNYIRRGIYLAEGGEHEAAIRDFSRAARINNSIPEPLVERAKSLLALNQTGDAIRDCATAIEISEQAQSVLKQNQAADSIRESTAAIESANAQAAYSVRGDAWMVKEQYSRAIADYEKANRFDTTVAEAYLRRARQYEQAGNAPMAAADRKQAKAIDPLRRL